MQEVTPRATTDDFRHHLQQELVRRCKQNPRYSLRAFARALSVEPAFLSKMISGKRPITRATRARLGDRLGLGPQEMEKFELRDSRGSEAEFHQLTLDQFQVIADWHHFAILELVTVEDFEPSTRWVAQALGLSPVEIQAAVDRLVRLGFLEITPEGRWVNVSRNNTTIGTALTAVALRKLQAQILDQAKTALEEVPATERDQSGVTLAIRSRDLPAAKERIRQFRRDMVALLQQEESGRDQVYQLSISFFPASRKRGKTAPSPRQRLPQLDPGGTA